ncbi:hypothetical protein ACIPPJ_33435 [Streptomyces sp. NPDC086091]|uniref:hypothetical protein n=1 Tax=Streptomyces sp. NPDC086091 TaxID=3365751 RepID=UPI003828004E
MRHSLPLANGIRTDHPVPGLPFVDDLRLPLLEGPQAVAAWGSDGADGMWGRWDKNDADGGWHAFTTDPRCPGLGWAVRCHPGLGRTVVLMSDRDLSAQHVRWSRDQLLFRAGGHWFDGSVWYRPEQLWDPVAQDYERRPARGAVSVTAAGLLDGHSVASHPSLLDVASFDPHAPGPDAWLDHLALWARHRQEQKDALPLTDCVVDVSGPELTSARMIGIRKMAELGGVTVSTLRAHLARGSGEVPLPQTDVRGHGRWSRAVAEDWVDSRKRSFRGVSEAMAAGDRHRLSPGAASLRDRLTVDFRHTLRDRLHAREGSGPTPDSQEAVGASVGELALAVATGLPEIVPTHHLSETIRTAVLSDWARSVRLSPVDDDVSGRKRPPLTPAVAGMLDWFIRYFPGDACACVEGIQYHAHRRWGMTAGDSLAALRSALSVNGDLTEQQRVTYFSLLQPRFDPV